ncbi:MAG: transposase, partial [Microcystaceae cyanobacterium]
MTRLRARAIKGQRAYGDRPQQRGKNVTLIGAIALKGLVAEINLLGSIDSLTFEAFMIRHLIPNLWKDAYVLMDNASIHQEKVLRPLIESVGAQLDFLPPYSPDFSPIENCWSKLKSSIRSLAPRRYQDLEKAIISAFEQISLKDIHHWFTHC